MNHVTVLCITRDCEPHFPSFVLQMERLENTFYDTHFEYYFFENDSFDRSKALLSEFMSSRKGRVVSERHGTPKYNRKSGPERLRWLAYCRNRLLEQRPFRSEWTLVVDCDVEFSPEMIGGGLAYSKTDPQAVMLTPYGYSYDIRPCKRCEEEKGEAHCKGRHYYDTLSFLDLRNERAYSHHFSSYRLSCSPFMNENDKKLWRMNKAVEVRAAFGGVALIKTKYLNQNNVRWGARENMSEHVEFCSALRKNGKVMLLPHIMVRHPEIESAERFF